jgi:hypothetical protein
MPKTPSFEPSPRPVPSYRKHKSSGQAVVTLSGLAGRRRDVLLGKFGSKASRVEYGRVIAEWEARGRRLEQPGAGPTLSGRGFASIDAWHDIAERFEDSGRERLIVIVLSDYDPEGQMIPHVGGRTLRDDFGTDKLTIVQAGVTPEQIEEHNLPLQNFAKETSSNFDWFVAQTGSTSVYELEALPPEALLSDLDRVIRSVIDVDLYNREVEREREESAYITATQQRAAKALKGLTD